MFNGPNPNKHRAESKEASKNRRELLSKELKERDMVNRIGTIVFDRLAAIKQHSGEKAGEEFSEIFKVEDYLEKQRSLEDISRLTKQRDLDEATFDRAMAYIEETDAWLRDYNHSLPTWAGGYLFGKPEKNTQPTPLPATSTGEYLFGKLEENAPAKADQLPAEERAEVPEQTPVDPALLPEVERSRGEESPELDLLYIKSVNASGFYNEARKEYLLADELMRGSDDELDTAHYEAAQKKYTDASEAYASAWLAHMNAAYPRYSPLAEKQIAGFRNSIAKELKAHENGSEPGIRESIKLPETRPRGSAAALQEQKPNRKEAFRRLFATLVLVGTGGTIASQVVERFTPSGAAVYQGEAPEVPRTTTREIPPEDRAFPEIEYDGIPFTDLQAERVPTVGLTQNAPPSAAVIETSTDSLTEPEEAAAASPYTTYDSMSEMTQTPLPEDGPASLLSSNAEVGGPEEAPLPRTP